MTSILPKFSEAGVAKSSATAGGGVTTPVPSNVTLALVPALVKLIVPLVAPAAVGENVTVTLTGLVAVLEIAVVLTEKLPVAAKLTSAVKFAKLTLIL